MNFFSTPGFLAEAEKHNLAYLPLMLRLLKASEPTWIVGDPKATSESFEDEGRTLRIPAPFDFYIIKDETEEEGLIITAVLPEER